MEDVYIYIYEPGKCHRINIFYKILQQTIKSILNSIKLLNRHDRFSERLKIEIFLSNDIYL